MLIFQGVDDDGLFPSKKMQEKNRTMDFPLQLIGFFTVSGCFFGGPKKSKFIQKTMVNLSGTPPSDELKNWRMATFDVILCDTIKNHHISPS